MVCPGELGDMAVLDSVAGSEDGVQRVSCVVCGAGDQLSEYDVIHAFEKVGVLMSLSSFRWKFRSPRKM